MTIPVIVPAAEAAPALIVTVGLLVGFVALALFWPLLNLVGALS